jgi:hypothetical protein
MRFASRCQPPGYAQRGFAVAFDRAAGVCSAATEPPLPPHPAATSTSVAETPASSANALTNAW